MTDTDVLKNTTRFLIVAAILVCIFSSPVSADFIGPSHELADDGMEDIISVSQAEDENGLITEDGAITYNVTIETQNSKDIYPYIYPMELAIESESRLYGTESIFLSPTNSHDYVPRYGDNENRDEYELRQDFQVYIAFDDIEESDLDASGEMKRDLDFTLHSRMTGEETTVTSTSIIEDATPQGRSTDSFSITSSVGFDETAEIASVDRYRISSETSDPGFLEEFSIPNTNRFEGDINNFQNMRQPNTEQPTGITGTQDGFNMVTLTRNIQSSSPQTVIITYDILTDGAEIEVTPIAGSGNPIDPETEYLLKEDPSDSDYCRDLGSSENLCVFTLSDEEEDEINNLGELYLEYNADVSAINGNIACQATITGYLPDNAETCGKSAELTNPDDIAISAFEGKNTGEPDSAYTEYEFSADFTRDGLEDPFSFVDIDMRASIESNIDSEENVDVAIFADENINHEGVIGNDVDRETVTVEPGADEEVALEVEREPVDSSESVKVFYAVICDAGFSDSDCSTVDNIGIATLLVGMDDESGEPDLNVISPIRVDLDVADTTDSVEDRIRTQTTDSNFDRVGENWELLPSETIDNFEGEIEESVNVRDVSSSDPSNYEDEAIDKLSDISSEGSWNEEDYTAYVSETDRNVRYSSEDLSNQGYKKARATGERRAQVGTIQAQFQVITGDEFSSVIDSERGWYVDRENPNTNTETIDDSFETLERHTDPDECLNCLYSETEEEAEQRLETVAGYDVIKTEGGDDWERVSDEPVDVVNHEVGEEEIIESDEELGDSATKIKEREDEPDLWRRVDYETREIYEWRSETEVQSIEFNAPETEEVYKWVSETYDIEYQFTGDIETPSTLYTYQREIINENVIWDESTEWFDVSESVDYQDNTDLLNLFGIQYQSRSEVNYVHWVDELHQHSPDSEEFRAARDSVCDEETIHNKNVPGGAGGEGVIQQCEVDGEDITTKFGKSYDDEGVFVEEITLWDDNLESDTQNVVVNVNEGEGAPTLDVDGVNNRVDYSLDEIPFTGTIESSQENLDDRYQLVVTPADVFESSTECPSSGYTESEEVSLQHETTTTDTFRQTVSCNSDLFEDGELAEDSDSFQISEFNSETDEITYGEIDAGAIQACERPLASTDDENTCLTSTGDEITYKSAGSYQSVDAEKLENECPAGYERESNTNGDITEYHCNLEIEPSITIKERQISVDYQEIQAGVVEQCSNIPTSSESGIHAGYTGEIEDGDVICELADSDDPGPDEFVLSEEQGEYTSYNSPPAGAVRGAQYDSDAASIGTCEDFNITEQGVIECEYETANGDYITINYATITEGNWSNIRQDINSIGNDEPGQKITWESDFVVEGEEDFTTLINPRKANFNIEENQDVTFEFKLQTTNGDTIQRENIDIKLCQSSSTQNLPLEDNDLQRSTFCESDENGGFDALLTGEPDFLEEHTTVEEAIEQVESGEEDNYIIESVKNDACPYNANYPRNHGSIDALVVSPDDVTGNEYRALTEKAENHVISRYDSGISCAIDDEEDPSDPDPTDPGGGDGSSGFEFDEDAEETTPRKSLDETFSFGPESFVNAQEVDNIRRINQTHLEYIHEGEPMQSLWDSNFGDSLRLGSPVTAQTNREYYVNNNMVAMYTFDHEPMGRGNNPNEYRVTDVYPTQVDRDDTDFDQQGYEEVESMLKGVYTNNNIDSEDALSEADEYMEFANLHHAQIWYGDACATGQRTHSSAWDDEEFDGYTGINCESDIDNFNLHNADDTINNQDIPSEWPIYREWNPISQTYDYTTMDIPIEQSAFLPAPPSELSQVDVSQLSDEEKFGMSDRNERYGDGLFGGNALSLDKESWLLVSAPCVEERSGTLQDGYGGYNEGVCTMFEGSDNKVGLTEELYQDEEIPENDISQTIENDNWAVSFWVKQEGEDSSASDRNVFDLSESEHPIRQIFSISHPESEVDTGFISGIFNEEIFTRHSIGLGPYTRDDGSEYQPNSRQETSRFGFIENEEIIQHDDSYVLDDTNNNAGSYEMNEWQHVTVTRTPDDDTYGSFTWVYVDGNVVARIEDDDISTDIQDDVEVAEIYEDSTISIGAAYQEPSFIANERSDNKPIPQISGSTGNILVDDLRIYNEYMPPEDDMITHAKIDRLSDLKDENDRKYTGEITSDAINKDRFGEDIEGSLTINSEISVNKPDGSSTKDTRVEVIPCDTSGDGVCLEDASVSFGPNSWDRPSSFDVEAIEENEDFEDLTHIQLNVEINSLNIEETPLINNIDVNVVSSYNTCQEINENHDGYSGQKHIYQQLMHQGEIADVICDMDTDDGGWTRFMVAEDGMAFSVYDNRYDEKPLMPEKPLSDCESGANTNCFTTAEFSIPPSMSIDDFNVENEEELKPQILIKSFSTESAYERGVTGDWAIYTLDNDLYHEGLVDIIQDMFEGNYEEESDTFNTAEDCVEPTSEGYNTDIGCINDVFYLSNSPVEESILHMQHISPTGETASHIDIEQSPTEGVTINECLGNEDAYTCEVYYRMGTVGDLSDFDL